MFWESPRFTTDLAGLHPTLVWQQDLNRKIAFTRRVLVGLERAKDIVPGSVYDRRRDIYPAYLRALQLHRSAPQTLLHQDLHLGNWLRDPSGRMGLYDWQCVARGHWALDYAYALAGALAPENRRHWEEDLLRRYLEGLGDTGVQAAPTFDEAWLAYRQQPLHALVFGLFTLGGSRFEPELQPRAYTRSAIKRISQQVADLDTIGALSE